MTISFSDKTVRKLLLPMLLHDLDKPLLVMGRVMERLLAGRLDPEDDAHAFLMRSAAAAIKRARRMTADLSVVGGAGKVEGEFGRHLLGTMMEKAANEFYSVSHMEDRRFAFNCLADGDIYTDPNLVHRIMDNLLYNALSHTEPGAAIWLNCAVDLEGGYWAEVENEGPVIPEAFLEKIFDPMVQLTLRSRRKWRGQGLGLTFCRLAAEALGGRIKAAQSADGGGMVFRLSVEGAGGRMIQDG